MSAQPVVSGERLVMEHGATSEELSGKRAKTTAPPPMSEEDYDALAKSEPPPDQLAPFDTVPIELEEDLGVPTRPPAARRAASLARMDAWAGGYPYGRSADVTRPSRRSSDPSVVYDVRVPPAPGVPALTLPNMPAARFTTPTAEISTARPTPFGARARLEDRSAVPRHAVPAGSVKDLAIDHRAGFLMSLIDGKTTIEDLLDLCPLPEDEALSVLASLLVCGVVALSSSAGSTGPDTPGRPRRV